MPETDLALLIDAAREASVIALSYWQKSPRAWQKEAGQGPVTEADLAVDRMLRVELLAARPGYGWLSEETEDDALRLGRERVFIVDPIDGTRAFVEGGASWAHSLAIVERGAVVAAVVALPARQRLYTAQTGKGAALNGVPLRASRDPELDGARVLATRATFDERHWPGGRQRSIAIFVRRSPIGCVSWRKGVSTPC